MVKPKQKILYSFICHIMCMIYGFRMQYESWFPKFNVRQKGWSHKGLLPFLQGYDNVSLALNTVVGFALPQCACN